MVSTMCPFRDVRDAGPEMLVLKLSILKSHCKAIWAFRSFVGRGVWFFTPPCPTMLVKDQISLPWGIQMSHCKGIQAFTSLMVGNALPQFPLPVVHLWLGSHQVGAEDWWQMQIFSGQDPPAPIVPISDKPMNNWWRNAINWFYMIEYDRVDGEKFPTW